MTLPKTQSGSSWKEFGCQNKWSCNQTHSPSTTIYPSFGTVLKAILLPSNSCNSHCHWVMVSTVLCIEHVDLTNWKSVTPSRCMPGMLRSEPHQFPKEAHVVFKSKAGQEATHLTQRDKKRKNGLRTTNSICILNTSCMMDLQTYTCSYSTCHLIFVWIHLVKYII